MKPCYKLWTPAIGMLVPVLVFIATDLLATDNQCLLRAENETMWVRVFDVDKSGNIIDMDVHGGYLRPSELWKGVLKKGETKAIKSSTGTIRYDYKSASDYRTYGNIEASCSHGEIIRLP